MDSDHLIPFFFSHVEDHSISQDAGHVDEDIQLAEFPDCVINDALSAAYGGDIHRVANRNSAAGLDFRHHFIRGRRRFSFAVHRHAKIIDHDRGTVSRHRFRDGATDSASATGYNCCFAVEDSHVQPPVAPTRARRAQRPIRPLSPTSAKRKKTHVDQAAIKQTFDAAAARVGFSQGEANLS
jgi:hypothetical protein